MTRRIDLKEYGRSEPERLSAAELRTLHASELSIGIVPTGDAESEYYLTPGSIVGAVEIGDLSVLIEPKIPIPQLLSLVCYAMSRFVPQRGLFDFPREYALPDLLALALASAARRAFSRGLLHGYRTEEEALHTVRGRIMFAEQIRRRYGVALPIEVRYDEFTDDIPANRLLKAGGVPARRYAAALAGGADRVGLGRRDARQRLAGRVPA